MSEYSIMEITIKVANNYKGGNSSSVGSYYHAAVTLQEETTRMKVVAEML